MINVSLSVAEIQHLVAVLYKASYQDAAPMISLLNAQAAPQLVELSEKAKAEAEVEAKAQPLEDCDCEEGCEKCEK